MFILNLWSIKTLSSFSHIFRYWTVYLFCNLLEKWNWQSSDWMIFVRLGLPGFPKYIHVVVVFYLLHSNRGFIENTVSPSYTMYVILYIFRKDDYYRYIIVHSLSYLCKYFMITTIASSWFLLQNTYIFSHFLFLFFKNAS